MTPPQLQSVGERPPIVRHNPANGTVVGQVPDVGAEAVRAAVARARKAQAEWAALPIRTRGERMFAFRDQVVRRAEEIADALSRETGKPRNEALAMEILLVADLTTYFAKRAHKILEPERLPLHLLPHRTSYIHWEPRGVVGIISPWNFPFAIPVGDAMMALVAGNAVVVKPSEVTPLIAVKAKELWDDSGLPPDLFQVVTGRGETGAALIDSGIDLCIFTGSVPTGRRVGAACGERLIPCILELGGKAPAVVCADADLERTANALVWGAFANSGQICVSVERAYIHEAVYDELIGRVVEQTKKLRIGDPNAGNDVEIGAMCWDRQREIVKERVQSATAAGARVLTGGKERDGGLFYEPTVLVDCKQDMDVMRKEIFGPLLPIMKVRDEEEAVRLANDSELGLMAYVFTTDRQKGKRLAERIEAGTVMINDVMATYGAPETPWGGLKTSGLGHTHGHTGLKEMCQMRHVNVDRVPWFKREPFWFPYTEKTFHQGVKVLQKLLFRPRS